MVKTLFDMLPDELIYDIYEKKHKLEMKGVMQDLKERQLDRIDDVWCLLHYFKNERDVRSEWFGVETRLNICVALVNEGLMGDSEFDKNYDDVLFEFGRDYSSDLEYWEYDTTLSLSDILFQNDDLIGKAQQLQEDSDNWILNNVN